MSNKGEILDQISQKYNDLEEPELSYLKGLNYAKPINYWEYIQLETLLSIQNTRTDFEDEKVFIMYHQVTELILNMMQHELDQVTGAKSLSEQDLFDRLIEKLNRSTRYIQMLTKSFEVMKHGMSPKQYNKFRFTLTPASGFQSVAFRLLELSLTSTENLIHPRYRDKVDVKTMSIKEQVDYFYWQAAGRNFETGKKSYLLKTFEQKYLNQILSHAENLKKTNVLALYNSLPEHLKQRKELVDKLKEIDQWFNVEWPLVHFETADIYLNSGKKTVAATGGSKWQEYLHPKYQKRVFFPQLWTKEALDNWGDKKSRTNNE